jgi:monoamine oxidase
VFINGDRAREWSGVDAPTRRAAVLEQLARWFGPEAAQPIEYIEKDWTVDEHTGGCPIATFGANVLSRFGLASRLAEPCWPAVAEDAFTSQSICVRSHRLHWAGTESSEIGTGFMDGAVRAGLRASASVLADLPLLIQDNAKGIARKLEALPATSDIAVQSVTVASLDSSTRTALLA